VETVLARFHSHDHDHALASPVALCYGGSREVTHRCRGRGRWVPLAAKERLPGS